MFKIQLFKDLPDRQSLEAPFEIIVQSYTEIVMTIVQIQMGDIKYDWSRIIISKEMP